MFDFAEIFRSVEHIWILWVLSASALVAITWWTIARISWRELLRWHRGEKGSAYTLAYVGVIPIYALLMCLVVETTLALVAKFGTLYAGYAASRTAVVWIPHAPAFEANAKIQQAAVQAFAPFSNGVEAMSSVDAGGVDGEAERYVAAYKAHVENPKSLRYLRSKYVYAQRAITASAERRPQENAQEDWQYDIVTTIEYRYAFHVPVLGRLIGTTGPNGFFLPIRSTVRLTGEAPQNQEQSLGIRYGSP